jgi:hypothetical protein
MKDKIYKYINKVAEEIKRIRSKTLLGDRQVIRKERPVM